MQAVASTGIVRRCARLCCALALVAAGACSKTPALAPLAGDSIILAFGDSLTHGTGAQAGQSYPAALERLTGITVINAGVPGETSARGLRRLPGELARARPDLLILCHGGNDILRRMDRAGMQRNLTAMIELAQQQGVQVVLLAVPDFSLLLSAADEYDAVADSTGVPYQRDIIPAILKRPSLKADQIHPNAEGYSALAAAVRDLLVEAGALAE